MARRAVVPKGRFELLNWMNEFLESDYTKVEQACDGIAYAQIVDCACGQRMPLQKFNFAARHEDDFERNLTVLQQEFKKLGIEHPVPVARLAKGRFQDNNEFLLWCFSFLHNCAEMPQDYPSIARRQEALHRQVRAKGKGTLPPACVKTELAYGIDLDAPPPQQQQSYGQHGYIDSPEVAPAHRGSGVPSSFSRVQPAGDSYLEGDAVQGFATAPGGGVHSSAAEAGPAPGVPGLSDEDYAVLKLGDELAQGLCTARHDQEAQRRSLEGLAKERNSMWQQLRTIEELLGNFKGLDCPSVDVIRDILYERDPRMVDR